MTETTPTAETADRESEGADERATDADESSHDEDGKENASEEREAISGESAKKAENDLIPKGNRLRMARGIGTMLAGAIGTYVLAAKNGQNAWSIPIGIVFVLICAFGVMDLLGTFDDEPAEDQLQSSTSLRAVMRPLLFTVALTLAFGGSLVAAQIALVPWWVSSIAVTGTFLGLVACVFELGRALGPWAKDELGEERALFRRHGFWVIAAGAALYFPSLGLFSLWDPWETHYGEVAREILSRDDWISLWWAQDGWFWSKPILNFWIQSLAMGTLGTHFQPGGMLQGYAGAGFAHPEWVVRTPNVLMTIGAMYLLYKGVAKVFGRRAGLLGGLVLATMPDWFFLAHQTMTDMPFVAAMTAAMGLLLVGLNTPEEERVRLYELTVETRILARIAAALGVVLTVFAILPGQSTGGRTVAAICAVLFFGGAGYGHYANRTLTLRLSLWHLVFGAVLLCAIPQIIYLFSRNLELVAFGDGPHGFRVHWDEMRSGSAGNCGLPGNENCRDLPPASVPRSVGAHPEGLGPSLIRFFGGVEPSLQAIVWSAVIGVLLYLNWGERRTRRLVYIAAWLCAAIATMAKGPAGFGLPIICAFAYVATKKRWSEILRLEMVSGFLIIFAVALPWYVAMYVRHGPPFTDRLIFHDMFNRAFSHVHDTNEGDDTGVRYYLWQLGYALFPWTALAPLGLSWWLRKSDSADRGAPATGTTSGLRLGASGHTGDASVMLFMWFLFAFALFTFMGTKFHHYIFPAVPPVAMLIGVVLDDTIGSSPLTKARSLWMYVVGLAAAAAVAVFGFARIWPGSLFGAKPDAAATGSLVSGLVIGGIGLALVIAVIQRFRAPRAAEEGDDSTTPTADTLRRRHEQRMIGAAALAGALLLVLVGRDLVIKPDGADQPGAIRLLHLFTYNYRRPWPDTLDFSAILGGFTLVGIVLALGFAVPRIRRHVVSAFCAFAFVWALWGVNVYMVAMSPHWGQHEVMEAYYKDRKGPDEQLVAYQMNWKGENFYTGNRVPAFVSSGATFQNWLKAEREKGARVMYFVTEHSRTGGLRSEVGGKAYKEITDRALNNKFVLVRAEL